VTETKLKRLNEIRLKLADAQIEASALRAKADQAEVRLEALRDKIRKLVLTD